MLTEHQGCWPYLTYEYTNEIGSFQADVKYQRDQALQGELGVGDCEAVNLERISI